MRHQNIRKTRSITCFLLTLLCFIAVLPASAQLDHGSFVGTITDSTGAGVPNAVVQVTSIDTGITVTTKSDGTGHYEVGALRPGRYRVEATAPAFPMPSQTT